MKTPIALGAALLLSTALTHPAIAQETGPSAPAQGTPVAADQPAPDSPTANTTVPGPDSGVATDDTTAQEDVDISVPGGGNAGGDIVVVGRNIPNVIRATPQVVSVLSAQDIQRTGEGDIAGALERVTGLSVVGEGFVYVRGLGDRYSLSLLNGSPLPSPDPLKRVVPLDLFPSSLIASALVQKSYSPNFPGEYGGGVINLTTKAIPTESFFEIGASIGYDTEVTRKLGYTYYGSKGDWTGFDSGARDVPDFIADAGRANATVSDPDQVNQLFRSNTILLQRNFDIPPAYGLDVSAGTAFDVGSDGRMGIIASVGYSNSWFTRDATRQYADRVGAVTNSYQDVSTDNRILVNALLGLGLEVGEHKFRLTNLFIHDTTKQAGLASGFNTTSSIDPTPGQPDPQIVQTTSFVERQLYDLQGAAELRFDALSVDLRGTYANTKRESPYEREFRYIYDSGVGDYRNQLNGNTQDASVTFSDLNENLYGGGIDIGYDLPTSRPAKLTAGYAYSKTERSASRYFFQYLVGGTGGLSGSDPLAVAISQLRPDLLISPDVIRSQNIQLRASSALGSTEYDADLEIHGIYGMAEFELADGLRVSGGVRWETADEGVQPIGFTGSTLSNDYFLPALTVTWNFAENMQLRAHASKTIARPQFRELSPTVYRDFSTNRSYIGNLFLQDSELYNAEVRYEWFFDRDQRLSVAGFYKEIDNPIESAAISPQDSPLSGQFFQGFSNAPKAELYGVEFELQKYFPLDIVFGGSFFETKRAVLIANYTYSSSSLKVGNEMIASPFPSGGLGTVTLEPAGNYFPDGEPLTGQSDHIANFQVGVEDTERLMQLTLLVNYASERVTTRVLNQPAFIEKPGVTFDIVYRQGFEIYGKELEIKAEARNLLSTNYEETQTFDNGTVVNINTYDKGPTFSFGASLKF